ncbi:putative translation machinery-associated protein 64 [Elsinoe australis]|uniref:Putative translation machinery-associated protein 64 n=1 Tax=Elsinoe australis TaxID=40998 RepID=A0A4U7AWM9_9PEZI|nr:putative translation machinery-associated protein 64 [Elsinoe australis]
MFKKKPQIKPLAPLRSSDRRKIADQIITDYGLEAPLPSDSTEEDKATATTKHTDLRNALLPDNIQTARFTTTHGPDLKKVSGTVYVGSHPGEDARVLWFKIEEQMFPTVYTLWQNPGIVPLLHTPEMVVEKIQGGADLMTPGLAGPPFPGKASKGATVAVASLDSPSVPVSVGSCLINVASLSSTQGAKGRAIETMHWAGDELWAFSTANKPGKDRPEEIPEWLGNTDANGLANSTAVMSLDEDREDGGVPLNGDAEPSNGTSSGVAADIVAQGNADDGESEPARIWTTKEIDEAFHNAFLYGVHEHIKTNPSVKNHGLDFPLSQSFVTSTLITPFLPTFSGEDSKQLQIKNTSFKNLKKFIKSLDKAMIIKAKDKPNETVILDIDFEDAAVKNFKPYRLPKKETLAGSSQGRGTTATSTPEGTDPSIGQKLSISSYCKPPERLSPLLGSSPPPAGNLYTTTDLKSAIASYIESENLISQTNKRLVTLNPVLSNALFTGAHPLDKEVLAKGTVPRDALTDRVISSSSPHFSITRTLPSSAQPETSKPRTGAPPKVKITLETRSGNKTVTKIAGVEKFWINPHLLADELRKTCAGSTSVEPLVGSSPKEGAMEVMVQGPQRDSVTKALGRRGVRELWVEVVDKTKKKK